MRFFNVSLSEEKDDDLIEAITYLAKKCHRKGEFSARARVMRHLLRAGGIGCKYFDEDTKEDLKYNQKPL